MLPVIAIIGRPNVGKSTLFNRFTQSRQALVADEPGVTRDRQYGEAIFNDRPFIVIDTGGIGEEEGGIHDFLQEQSQKAMQEADVVLLVVDGRTGLTPIDEALVQHCRRLQKPVSLVINKTDGIDLAVAQADFFKIGFTCFPISAKQNHGVSVLLETITRNFPTAAEQQESSVAHGIKFAIIGRPNVGKSTLTNRLLGEERVITFDEPGTTRDSIYIPFEHRGTAYTVIDTAGVRRKSKVEDAIEKFSVIKTLQAISDAHVVIIVLDATQEIAHQDLLLIGYALKAGKALVVAVNKWDGLPEDKRAEIKSELLRKLPFLTFAEFHFISAKHGSNVGLLYRSIDQAYDSAMRDLSTPELTRLLEKAQTVHQPPLVQGRRVKMRYAHAGGKNPPIIVIHGNQLDHLPEHYKRFLIGFFREALKLKGTPIQLLFQNSSNPFDPIDKK